MTQTYAIITPARDEAATLPQLASAIRRQTLPPHRWVIVENGSTDGTPEIARELERMDPRTVLVTQTVEGRAERGGPIVRALEAGLGALGVLPDVLVTVDADVTMGPDYFERLLLEFERDETLGIASGSAWELENGRWRQRFVTGGTVWGATRAYRWACLQDVLPLEARHGWDGVDELKARARGWTTRTFIDLGFQHHRSEGHRDGSRWAHWRANGDTAYFLGYRPWYLLARAAHQIRRDPAAFGLVVGYASARVRRSERLDDAGARAVLRSDQSIAQLLRRRREALGRSSELRSGAIPPRRTLGDRFRSRLYLPTQGFRRRRMRRFVERFDLTSSTRILDVGGTDANWSLVEQPAEVVLLHLVVPSDQSGLPSRLSYVQGDATELPYEPGAFDICFSNSAIEHVSTFERQRVFAKEMRRVGRGIWLQTPARSFPFEPHWLGVGIHWLPERWQRRLARNFTLWGLVHRPSQVQVDARAGEYRLLAATELRELFPDCAIERERFLGLTKSYIVFRPASARPTGTA